MKDRNVVAVDQGEDLIAVRDLAGDDLYLASQACGQDGRLLQVEEQQFVDRLAPS